MRPTSHTTSYPADVSSFAADWIADLGDVLVADFSLAHVRRPDDRSPPAARDAPRFSDPVEMR